MANKNVSLTLPILNEVGGSASSSYSQLLNDILTTNGGGFLWQNDVTALNEDNMNRLQLGMMSLFTAVFGNDYSIASDGNNQLVVTSDNASILSRLSGVMESLSKDVENLSYTNSRLDTLSEDVQELSDGLTEGFTDIFEEFVKENADMIVNGMSKIDSGSNSTDNMSGLWFKWSSKIDDINWLSEADWE